MGTHVERHGSCERDVIHSLELAFSVLAEDGELRLIRKPLAVVHAHDARKREGACGVNAPHMCPICNQF